MHKGKATVRKYRLFCLAIVFAMLIGVAPNVSAQFPSWQYCDGYSISNPNTELTDYQVKLTVDHLALVDGGKSRSDAGDFRFTDVSGRVLFYWIESGIGTHACVVWIKLPLLPALGIANIRFYYGSPGAQSVSSGDSTFVFFDDFTGSEVDAGKWSFVKILVDAGGTATVANSELTVVSGQTSIPPRASVVLKSKQAIDAVGPKKTRVRLKAPNWGGVGPLGTYHNCGWGITDQNGVDGSWVAFDENGEHVFGTSTNQSGNFSPFGYMIVECDLFPDVTTMAINDLPVTASASLITGDAIVETFGAGNWSSAYPSGKIVSDWIFVAKAAKVEPEISLAPLKIPQNGLVAYYPFSGNADDSSGNGYGGLAVGTTYGVDRFGNQNSACDFSGAVSYVQVNGFPILNQEHTYSAWVRVRGTGNIGCFGTVDSANGTWDMSYDNGTHVLWSYDRTNGQWGNAVVLGATWNHLVFTYGTNTRSVYVNGVLLNTQSIVTPVLSSLTDVLRIGRHTLNVQQFDGLIDDVRIYNRALSAYEVGLLYSDQPVPIQLASFTAAAWDGTSVRLEWSTLSETNNFGFYVQKRAAAAREFAQIQGSFVAGNGTTVTKHQYSYADTRGSLAGDWYRLQQIDLDGAVHVSDPIQAGGVTGVGDEKTTSYGLGQNYPNPFNPSTTIRYGLALGSDVTLIVFNTLGQQVATLVKGRQEAGYHEVRFDASGLSSGVYFYRLQAGRYVDTKRFLVVR